MNPSEPITGKNLPPAFLTYAWCRVTYVALHSLAARGVTVHVGDASRLAMCRYSRCAASFSRLPSSYKDPVAYVDAVAVALRRTGAKVLLPCHEDILIIAKYRDRLPADVLIPVADAEKIQRALSKDTIIAAAEEAGVDAPKTFRPGNREELTEHLRKRTYPAVVKPCRGNSGKGVSIVNDANSALAAVDALTRRFGLTADRLPVIQDFAPGEPYGVCMIYNRGQFRAGFAEHYLRAKDGQFGTSVFRISAHAPKLIEQARKLFDHLGWHGVGQLDFLYDRERDQSALIEMNPRFWGALDLSVRSGVDFPWLWYQLAVHGEIPAADLSATDYPAGIKSRWIVGELIHLANAARRLQIRQGLAALKDYALQRADGCDDFRIRDPLPLAGELAYYGTRFLAGGVNPVEEGMIG